MEKKFLEGGRIGKIQKIENTVIRPANIWTQSVHSFLYFIDSSGAAFVPKPYGINECGEEVVSFMPGNVYNALPKSLLNDSVIVSAAALLRKFHRYSEQYISRLTTNEKWMLPVVNPIEVMCHGDFAPYNVTIVDGQAYGIIDFDTLHPGPKMWDVVYASYRWVLSADFMGDIEEQIRKTKLFLDSYGVKPVDKDNFVTLLVRRLKCLMDYMQGEAQRGNSDFQHHIDSGHLQAYAADIKHIEKYNSKILKGIK